MQDPWQGDMARFLALVRRHLKLIDVTAELSLDASLDELGLDSQAALGLMLDLEEAFGVVFHDSMFTEETFATPEKLWLALSSLRQR
jgi:acyl carrier protein